MSINIITPKRFSDMTADEQTSHLTAIHEYISQKLPALRAKGRALGRQDIGTFHEGLMLLGAYPQFTGFAVRLQHIHSDYDQYIASMAHQFDLLTAQLTDEHTFRTSDGQQVIVLPQSQSLRRGRPTQAESEQRRREEQAASQAEAMAKLTGAKISAVEAAPVAERDSDTSRRKKDDEPDLFTAAVAEECGVAHTAVTSLQAPHSSLPTLSDWYWILPDALVARLRTERDLRSEMGSCSERVKLLFEQCAKTEDMAGYSQRVHDINLELADMHQQVDKELSLLYVMLTEVNAGWRGLVEKFERQQAGTRQQLLARLKHYHDKMHQSDASWYAQALARCQKLEAERVAAETRDPEKEKRLHTIDAYIRRKDVQQTEKRLQKMREYRQEATTLGADADALAAYDIFIANCEENVKSATNS